MKVQELIARFPEIPPVLHQHPGLVRFAEVFDEFLRVAVKPTNCSAHTPTVEHKAYTHLVSPMGFIRFGLATPEKTIERLEKLMADYESDPDAFKATIFQGAHAAPGGCQGEGHQH